MQMQLNVLSRELQVSTHARQALNSKIFRSDSFDKKCGSKAILVQLANQQIRSKTRGVASQASTHHQVVAERWPHDSSDDSLLSAFCIDGEIDFHGHLKTDDKS